MFKNDRFMTIITALVLAIFAGTMVRYGDRIMAIMSGEDQFETHDDFYSVRANARQTLDVLANDDVKGPIILLTEPKCGVVSLAGSDMIQYASTQECSGKITFAYCVEAEDGCSANNVTVNVVAVEPLRQNTPVEPESESVIATSEGENPEVGSEAPQMATAETPESTTPQIGQIDLTMRAPTLAAPSVDEIVSPDAALSGIRNQTVLMSDTPENLDQNIGEQSSAEVASNTGLNIEGIAAPVIEADETAGVLLGADIAVAPPAAVIVPNAPVGLTASASEKPLEQAERGPIALANLQGNDLSSFDDADGDLQEIASLSLASETPQPPNVTAESQVLAELDEKDQSPTVAAVGPIALIALQVKAPSNGGNIGEDMNLVLAEPNAPLLASMQAVPRLAAQVAPGPEGLTLLEREPASLTQAPGFQAVFLESLLRQATPDAQVALSSLAARLPNQLHSRAIVTSRFATRSPLFSLATGDAIHRDSTVQVRLETSGLPEVGVLAFPPVGLRASPHTQAGISGALQPLLDPAGELAQLPQVIVDPAPKPIPDNAVELASLDNAGADTPDAVTAIDQASVCEISLDPSVRSGAMILLFVTAECKPQMPVTIAHAGMEFTVLMGEDGTASISFPALEHTAEISASFADGTQADTIAIVPQIDQLTRVAVSWRGDADLDLHAFEYGATREDEGHVWAGAPRDARLARNGGGYLLSLGDPEIADGALAEVYTMPLRRNQERGIVAMSLEIADGTQVCGGSFAATTIAMRDETNAIARNIRFNTPTCDQNQANIIIPRAVNDIRMAGR